METPQNVKLLNSPRYSPMVLMIQQAEGLISFIRKLGNEKDDQICEFLGSVRSLQ